MTVLVLCHGNICRSPLAAAVMKRAGLEDVISAGFKPGGKRSPKKMREWAAENATGIDLSEHRSTEVTAEMLKTAEWILYMDGGQRKRLERLWTENGLEELRGSVVNFCEPLAYYLEPPAEKIADPMFAGNKDDPRFIAIMHHLIAAAENFVKQRNETPIVEQA